MRLRCPLNVPKDAGVLVEVAEGCKGKVETASLGHRESGGIERTDKAVRDTAAGKRAASIGDVLVEGEA